MQGGRAFRQGDDPVTRFRFVSANEGACPVKRLCELVECPRSGYYVWRDRPLSDRYVTDAALANEIYDVHVASQRTYGTPRVLGQLQHRNRRVGRKRVARIMAECGLVGVHGRCKWRRGRSASSAPAPDLIGCDFTAEASNQALGGRHHRVQVPRRQALPDRHLGSSRSGSGRLVDVEPGDREEGDPPHPRRLDPHDAKPASDRPVRLHRDLLPPTPTPTPPRPPNTGRDLHRLRRGSTIQQQPVSTEPGQLQSG